jgi:hypothetical protein
MENETTLGEKRGKESLHLWHTDSLNGTPCEMTLRLAAHEQKKIKHRVRGNTHASRSNAVEVGRDDGESDSRRLSTTSVRNRRAAESVSAMCPSNSEASTP